VDRPLVGDSVDYHGIAISFLSGDGWKDPSGHLSYRPPLMSAQLVVLYSAVGVSVESARWVMVLISSLVAPMLFVVALKTCCKGRYYLSFFIGVIWAFYPPSIYYSSYILTENMAALLSVASLWGFVYASNSKQWLPAVLTGIIWALAVLNRPIWILLPFSILFVQALFYRSLPYSWTLKQWLMGMVAFIVFMSPWTIRNYDAHDVFMPTTSGLGYMMILCNTTLDHNLVRSGMYYKNTKILENISEQPESEWGKIGSRLALEHVSQNVHNFTVAVLNRAKNFWTFRPAPYDVTWTRNDWIMFIIWIPLLISFILSFFIVPWRSNWLALVMILYAFIFTLPFWGTPRFRFPVDVFIIIQAVMGFMGLIEYLHRKRHLPLLITSCYKSNKSSID